MTKPWLGGPEVASLLGVSQQRVRQLVDDDPEFPDPARVERRGRWVRKYWDRRAVERYGKATGRIE